VQLVGALAVMGVVLWVVSGASESWLYGAALTRALRLTAVVLLGAGSYFLALWVFGLRPRDFLKRVG
jgi:putative peptidoglycan lipid II flippase